MNQNEEFEQKVDQKFDIKSKRISMLENYGEK